MKKLLSICLIFVIVFMTSTSTFAYQVRSQIPGTDTLYWYTHNTMSTTEKSAATSAAQTWNYDFGTTTSLVKYSSDSSGTIVIGDSRSDVVFISFDSLEDYGVPSSANGACVTTTDGFVNFDIFLNTLKSWGSGNSTSYLDRQGIFTHEFGHACGLGDVYGINALTAADVVTMYGYSSYLGSSCSYYFRTLTTDDKNGKEYVYSLIN